MNKGFFGSLLAGSGYFSNKSEELSEICASGEAIKRTNEEASSLVNDERSELVISTKDESVMSMSQLIQKSVEAAFKIENIYVTNILEIKKYFIISNSKKTIQQYEHFPHFGKLKA